MNYTRRETDFPITDTAMEDSSPAVRLATLRQRRIALLICVSLIVATMVFFPLAQTKWPKIPAFLSMNQVAIFGAYLITAYLMFGHSRATGSKALLHLSAGCFYTATVVAIQFLSFPAQFIEGQALLGGPQTATWLWLMWHVGPAVSILLYAWRELRHPASADAGAQPEHTSRPTVLVMVLAIAGTIAMVTQFHDWLPVLDVDGDFSRLTSSGVAPALQMLLVFSLVLLWRASRFRHVLHLWLGITLVAIFFDITLTAAGASRLTLGWYFGRLGALISSFAMMFVYLSEINRSHRQSMRAVDQLGTAQVQIIEHLHEEIRVRKDAEEQLQHSYTQLLQLTDHQEAIRNDERRRIAIDIHDDLGQTMMALKIDISMLHARAGKSHPRLNVEVKRVLGTIDSAIKSVRAIINDLYPSALELGLVPAVEWLLDQVGRRHAIHCTLQVIDDSVGEALDKRQTAAIFRIMQESLANIVRHAQASEVKVSLDLNEQLLSIWIEDNGVGMLPGDRSKTKSFGLKGIKQRIDAFGGTLHIDSQPGKGTALSIRMPMSISEVTTPGPSESILTS